jgi:glutathione S-transferase
MFLKNDPPKGCYLGAEVCVILPPRFALFGCRSLRHFAETNSQEKVAPEMKSAVVMEKAKADLVDCLRILNGGLEGRSFLIGDYSLADTHLQGIVGWIGSMDIDLTPFPNVTEWLKRCYERPAIAKLMRG